MTDDEFEDGLREACDEIGEEMAAGLDVEHEVVDSPAYSVLLHRHLTLGEHTYIETAWVQGYPRIRAIVVTIPRIELRTGGEMPGVVREIPVGFRDMASPEKFATNFATIVDSYQINGWTVVRANGKAAR